MTKYLLCFLVLGILARGTVIPKPTDMHEGNEYALDLTDVSISINKDCSDIVREVSETVITWASQGSPWKNITQSRKQAKVLQLTITKCAVLTIGVDESYSISMDTQGVNITADTQWGLLRGLATLSQLTFIDISNSNRFLIPNAPVTVSDFPRFAHRELMIDTSRHYLPPSLIMETIDRMFLLKMSVLHWHIVDAQSFPLSISITRNIAEAGAYSPRAIYDAGTITLIQNYATRRGIVLIPEIDIPGHAASWGFGNKELTAECPSGLQSNINNIPLNPANDEVFTLISGITKTLGSLTGNLFFHFGMDEVVGDCWMKSPDTKIQDFISKNKISSWKQIYQLFGNFAMKTAKQNGMTPVCWNECYKYLSNLDTDTIVHIWHEPEMLPEVLLTHKAIYSAGWYLDVQIPDPLDPHYLMLDTFIDFYLNDPVLNADPPLSEAQIKNFIGGGAAMWGEQVNRHSFMARVFPRIFAIAERLWSPMDPDPASSVSDMRTRMNELACRFSGFGFSTGPIWPNFCQYDL